MTLREVLHAHIPTLSSSSTFRDAVDKMDIYQFQGLVLVDGQLRPFGVITEGDLSRAIVHRGNLADLANEKASDFCSKDPVTMGPGTEISDALHLMISRGITLLPVVEEGRMIGIVLRVDLMQALLMDLKAPPA
ncbi:MAG: CBS domain-containing protein [Fimbriimonadaceae bacterium]|jgi:CBS domain-containing protein|nr:CBS domain-containing protein [Fimbriimonadaceae bacterium]